MCSDSMYTKLCCVPQSDLFMAAKKGISYNLCRVDEPTVHQPWGFRVHENPNLHVRIRIAPKMIFMLALPQVCWYETYQKFKVDASLTASTKATVNLIDGAWQVHIIDATNSGMNSPWQTNMDTVDGLTCLSATK